MNDLKRRTELAEVPRAGSLDDDGRVRRRRSDESGRKTVAAVATVVIGTVLTSSSAGSGSRRRRGRVGNERERGLALAFLEMGEELVLERRHRSRNGVALLRDKLGRGGAADVAVGGKACTQSQLLMLATRRSRRTKHDLLQRHTGLAPCGDGTRSVGLGLSRVAAAVAEGRVGTGAAIRLIDIVRHQQHLVQ